MGKKCWENAATEMGSTVQNGAEEEPDVDSMMNDKWHRIANAGLDEVAVSAATRHLPDRLVINCGHQPQYSCQKSFRHAFKNCRKLST